MPVFKSCVDKKQMTATFNYQATFKGQNIRIFRNDYGGNLASSESSGRETVHRVWCQNTICAEGG